jgi:hypothetical protein
MGPPSDSEKGFASKDHSKKDLHPRGTHSASAALEIPKKSSCCSLLALAGAQRDAPNSTKGVEFRNLLEVECCVASF